MAVKKLEHSYFVFWKFTKTMSQEIFLFVHTAMQKLSLSRKHLSWHMFYYGLWSLNKSSHNKLIAYYPRIKDKKKRTSRKKVPHHKKFNAYYWYLVQIVFDHFNMNYKVWNLKMIMLYSSHWLSKKSRLQKPKIAWKSITCNHVDMICFSTFTLGMPTERVQASILSSTYGCKACITSYH